MAYYWICKGKNFGKKTGFGEEIKGLGKSRIAELTGKGLISETKPESVTAAEKNKIHEIQKVNAGLNEELLRLQEELLQAKGDSEKPGPPKLKEAKLRIKELEVQLEEQLEESEVKIKELEAQLEEATAPKDQ